MKTPNIDRLASEGVRFDHHYVQMAVCIPSRVALLTSLRSERTKQVYGPMRWQTVPDAAPLGKTFKSHGYQTASLGKIWHSEREPSGDDFDVKWSGKKLTYAIPENQAIEDKMPSGKERYAFKGGKEDVLPPITEAADAPDSAYIDGQTAEWAIKTLHDFKQNGKPFIVAVGFHKPHLPFVAPKRYWDLYDPAQLPLAPQPEYPKGMPVGAFNKNPNFVGKYDYGVYAPLTDGFGTRMSDNTARHLIHGYAAAASFADAQVGRVLDALREMGLEQSTLVVLWGDHGFHLGDLNMWGKQSNFERAARSPVIVRAPGMAHGVACSELVETVDIFPTLLDFCGLPAMKITDGKSFVPLLRDPTQPWKPAAYHVFNRSSNRTGGKGVIGFAVRTKDARYVEWHEGWSLDAKLVAREFYRYTPEQPDEVVNEVDSPERAPEVARHAKLLRENPALTAER
jgi:arylsulfatase A-like enzyme